MPTLAVGIPTIRFANSSGFGVDYHTRITHRSITHHSSLLTAYSLLLTRFHKLPNPYSLRDFSTFCLDAKGGAKKSRLQKKCLKPCSLRYEEKTRPDAAVGAQTVFFVFPPAGCCVSLNTKAGGKDAALAQLPGGIFSEAVLLVGSADAFSRHPDNSLREFVGIRSRISHTHHSSLYHSSFSTPYCLLLTAHKIPQTS